MTGGSPGACDGLLAAATQAVPVGHPRATLAATILGSSLAFIDGSVVNVALPALGADLSAGPGSLAWIISAYLLTLSALILMGGALGDHYGRRRLFLGGIAVFLVASLACAWAPSLGVMLGGRALQGVGAALLMPNSLALLGASFEGEAKGRAIGTWAGAGALAGAAGPLLGGWLVEAVGWRSIFLINLPVGAAAAWLAWAYVPESRDRRVGARLDVVGAVLVTASLALLTWSLTAAAAGTGADPTPIAIGAVVGVALLALFVRTELRLGSDALMPLFLAHGGTFVGVTLLTFFLYAALGGLIVLLPFALIRAEGYSPVEAGAAMLPIPILIGLGSRFMGRVAARVGGRLPLGLGALIVAGGLALYIRLGATGDYWRDVLPATFLVAVGMAICVAPLTTTVMGSVDADHVGAASGFNSAVARIGGLIATALLGFVFVEQGSREALLAGVHAAALVGAAVAAVAGACALVLIRTSPQEHIDG